MESCLLPRRSSSEDPYGTAGLFVMLSGVLGMVSFLSTALTEIAGVLLLLVAVLHALVMLRTGVRPRARESLPRISLLFWCLYLAALLCSLASGGASVISHAGLLWHPLLFPAVLLIPYERRDLKTAGILFVLGGAAS